MARDITAATAAESKKSAGAKRVAFVKLALDSGDVRAWSGRGDMTFNGEVYTGVGDLGKISAIEEGVELTAFGLTLELSGIPSSVIAIALGEPVQGRRCSVWEGFLDSSYALIADPVLVFKGRLDTMDVELGETARVVVTAESRLADWNRARIRRYTDASQQERFPGDKFFEFVSDTAEKEIIWGASVAGGKGGGAVAG